MTANYLKWIERLDLEHPHSKEGPDFIKLVVPAGAEFIGVQQDR